MLKHVQLSPFRSRADTLSLSSTASYSSLSPEPLSSRSSSYSSLSESSPSVVTLKEFNGVSVAREKFRRRTPTFSFQSPVQFSFMCTPWS
ncbi:hypothetical protein L9F63_006178, partial [Diploptera punctata]